MIKYLFKFSGPEFDLVEVKRLDLPASAPKSQVYQWLKIDKTGKESRLMFVSMSEDKRVFTNGTLIFDEYRGTFTDQTGTYSLKRVATPPGIEPGSES